MSSKQPIQAPGPTVSMTRRGFWVGFAALAPIALFTLPFGVAFGAAAIEHGISPLQAILMSMLVFSGAGQFAALEVWTSPLPVLTIVLTVLTISARLSILSAAVSPWVNQRRPRDRLIALLFLSDPNFAHCERAFRSGERDIAVLLGSGVGLWICWVTGTTLGAIGGSALGDLGLFGIDVLMVAYFAALSADDQRSRTALALVVSTGLVAVLTTPFLPPGWNVMAAALVGGLIGSARHDP